MKKALITGVTGQDGSYLAELLLEKGYEVHGIIRRSSSLNSERIRHIFQDPNAQEVRFFLHYGDMTDTNSLEKILRKVKPNEVYNLAAQSHVMVSFEIPDYTGDVTALGAIRLLEAIRNAEIDCRFYQASSSELFGSTVPPQGEESTFRPRSPYAIAKLYAYHSTINYREAYGIYAVNGILFNHESPRRGETFVTRKISMAAARIARGVQDKLYLGNIDASRDWGYAPEYVHAMWEMLQMKTPVDLVIATGEAATVRDFLEVSFAEVGLDYRDYIELATRYQRPTEVNALCGDARKAKEFLGWEAEKKWRDIAKIMVKSDLEVVDSLISGRSVADLRLKG